MEDDIASCPQEDGWHQPSTPEPVISNSEEMNHSSPIIKPFTERQLLSLYQNEKITQAQELTEDFVASEQGFLGFSNVILSDLLNDYLRCRLSLISSEKSLEKLKKQLEDDEKLVWTLQDEKVENEGQCHDKVKVVAIHRYKKAQYNASHASSANRTMKHLREELFEHHSLSLFKSAKGKLKIESYLSHLCRQSEVKEDASSSQAVKIAISILFSFQRKIVADQVIVQETRSWLTLLCRTLMQNSGTFSDRLFLLNHVLRCPPGVGHWAASYVQVPVPSDTEEQEYLASNNLNQMVAMLALLFSPIRGRREMLREFCLPNRRNSAAAEAEDNHAWVVLDSDGEDDECSNVSNDGTFPLRENDFVALLNQFPFENLFKYLLKQPAESSSNFSIHSFFKLFAFGTQFVNLMKQGLEQFKAPIYRQLSKRLGRIIKHSLQYISDHWEDFQESQATMQVQDKAMLARIEIEYNNFFLRSARSIFCSSATSGMWQYLAVIPYKNVNEAVLWHVFAMYHFVDEARLHAMRTTDYSSNNFLTKIVDMLDAKDFRASFEDTLSGLPDTEVMFLLTTFAHMAIARTYQSSESFICFVLKELLSVGFLNEMTSPSCAKGCRDHLSTVTRTHPRAISFLLRQFSQDAKLVDSSVSLQFEFSQASLTFFLSECFIHHQGLELGHVEAL